MNLCKEILIEKQIMKYIPGRVLFSLRISKSKIHGLGAYALTKIPARKKLGELNGEIISTRIARHRAKLHKSIAIVELHNGYALDATENRNALCFINHSCQPNCYVDIRDGIIWIRASRTIRKGQELTYHYNTDGEGLIECRCRPGCQTLL